MDFSYLDGTSILQPTDDSLCSGTTYGHTMAVVGYEPGSTTEETTVTEWVLWGRRVPRWWPSYWCDADEWMCYRGYCCWYEEETTVVPGGSTGGYFILQNQWGSGWADGGRFKVAEDQNGDGWCGWQDMTFAV